MKNTSPKYGFESLPGGSLSFGRILQKGRQLILPGAVAFLTLAAVGVNAQTQPPGSLSITTYGATTGSSDNTTAIQNCINAAQSGGVGVWIPSGTFKVQHSLNATGITISGAGMSNSIIYRQKPNSSTDTTLYLTRCTVRDIGIDGNGTGRNNGTADGGLNLDGVGWLVERVKISHSDAGMWASGSSGTVQNCQLITVYADGINLNNGDGPNKLGVSLTAQNNLVDTHSDDGIAINSQGISLGRQNMQNPKVLNNETRNCQAANGLRIAGGVNSLVQGNNVHDQAAAGNNGIQIGRFGTDGFYLTGGQCVNNTFNHMGGISGSAGIDVYEDAQCTISGNNVLNANHHGIVIGSCSITLGDNNTVNHPNEKGIWITATSGGDNGGAATSGSANIKNNTVVNLNSGQPSFQNDAGGSMSVSTSGNSWQLTGAIFFQDYNYGAQASQVLTVGTYTLAQLAAKGMPNDWASSVQIPSGRTVIMYSDDNFSGQSWTLTANTPNFGSLTGNANDKVSSVKVQ